MRLYSGMCRQRGMAEYGNCGSRRRGCCRRGLRRRERNCAIRVVAIRRHRNHCRVGMRDACALLLCRAGGFVHRSAPCPRCVLGKRWCHGKQAGCRHADEPRSLDGYGELITLHLTHDSHCISPLAEPLHGMAARSCPDAQKRIARAPLPAQVRGSRHRFAAKSQAGNRDC